MKTCILDSLFQKDGAKRGITGLLRFTLQHNGLFSTSRSIKKYCRLPQPLLNLPVPISVCFHLNKGTMV